jgi:hypothetical protein
MNAKPKFRNRLGLTPFNWKPPDIDAYDGYPYRPYPNYERVMPPDLVQMLENNFHLLWKECEPFCIPEKYQGLKTIAHDELWENHPDNGVGGSRNEPGFGETSIAVKPRKSNRKVDPADYYQWTEDQVLGIDTSDPIKQKFYPHVRF